MIKKNLRFKKFDPFWCLIDPGLRLIYACLIFFRCCHICMYVRDNINVIQGCRAPCYSCSCSWNYTCSCSWNCTLLMFLELYLHHHCHDQWYIYAYHFWIMLSVTGSTSIPSVFIIDLGYATRLI